MRLLLVLAVLVEVLDYGLHVPVADLLVLPLTLHAAMHGDSALLEEEAAELVNQVECILGTEAAQLLPMIPMIPRKMLQY